MRQALRYRMELSCCSVLITALNLMRNWHCFVGFMRAKAVSNEWVGDIREPLLWIGLELVFVDQVVHDVGHWVGSILLSLGVTAQHGVHVWVMGGQTLVSLHCSGSRHVLALSWAKWQIIVHVIPGHRFVFYFSEHLIERLVLTFVLVLVADRLQRKWLLNFIDDFLVPIVCSVWIPISLQGRFSFEIRTLSLYSEVLRKSLPPSTELSVGWTRLLPKLHNGSAQVFILNSLAPGRLDRGVFHGRIRWLLIFTLALTFIPCNLVEWIDLKLGLVNFTGHNGH